MRESDILKQITDYLTAEKILWFRMNSGAMFGKHKGKGWAVRFGTPGMADILAFPKIYVEEVLGYVHWPVWIEVKTDKGKESAAQQCFGALVKGNGHHYWVCRSFEDVRKELGDVKS